MTAKQGHDCALNSSSETLIGAYLGLALVTIFQVLDWLLLVSTSERLFPTSTVSLLQLLSLVPFVLVLQHGKCKRLHCVFCIGLFSLLAWTNAEVNTLQSGNFSLFQPSVLLPLSLAAFVSVASIFNCFVSPKKALE